MKIRLLMAAPSETEYTDWREWIRLSGLPVELLGNADSYAALISMMEISLPDVVLVDARLWTHADCVQIFRQEKPFSRVLLVTDRADYDSAVDLFRTGIWDLLRLPQDIDRLYRHLQDILARCAEPIPTSTLLEQRRRVGKVMIFYARRVRADRQLNEQEVNSLFGTNFREGAFRFLTICFDYQNSIPSVDSEKYLPFAQLSVMNAVGELCWDMIPDCDYLRYHILLNYDSENDAKVLSLLQRTLDTVQAVLPAGALITFCCSQIHESISDMVALMDESGDAIWDRLQKQAGKLLIGAASTPCPKELQQILGSAEQRLKGACAILDVDQFRQELERLYRLPATYKTRYEVRSVLRRTEHYLLHINRKLIDSFEESDGCRWDFTLQLRRASTVEEYMRVYAERMEALFQRLLDESVGPKSHSARRAQQFIRQNYAMALNLDTVAKEVGLSPVYFSAVFKKEMGIGFVDFLNQCRIEQAKKLLAETGLKVAAVSEQTGFSSPRYFSRVFMNIVGVRPSEYRMAIEQNSDAVK